MSTSERAEGPPKGGAVLPQTHRANPKRHFMKSHASTHAKRGVVQTFSSGFIENQSHP